MKIGKEEIKKIFLSVLLFAGLLWGYFALLLGPLEDKEEKSTAGIATLEPQLADAKKQIAKTASLEMRAPGATAVLKQLRSTIPDGEPIAWFPPHLVSFFERHGIAKCTTRMISEQAEPGVPGFRKITWAVDLPKVEFIPLGAALASLENEEPLLNVLNVTVEANADDAQHQHAVLTVTSLVKS